jgi:hypothetical protein
MLKFYKKSAGSVSFRKWILSAGDFVHAMLSYANLSQQFLSIVQPNIKKTFSPPTRTLIVGEIHSRA